MGASASVKLPKPNCAAVSEKPVTANLKQLIAAARLLRPLLDELVFVGGSVTGLLITDEGAAEPRTTLDVDAIVEITSYAQYAAFGDRLRALGFAEDTTEDAPLCRWVHRTTILDVMPLDAKILGFSNRWYRAAMDASVTMRLIDDLEIRLITAPFFLATKFEAFQGRGQRDFFGSQDLEDVISVVDGRASLVTEIQAAAAELRAYIRDHTGRLLAVPEFLDALPGYLLPDAASQARISTVLSRLEALARL
jgi:predicted nucleotidyltransferase